MAETVNVREREFHRFLNYIKERGISQNLDNIELDKSQYLWIYILERTKEDEGIMDITTLHAIGKTNGHQGYQRDQGNQGSMRNQGNQENQEKPGQPGESGEPGEPGELGNQGNQRNKGNQGN